MRYGIIGDVHGNWEALSAVLDACQQEGVRAYFCVGDIVGYGANPIECIEKIKDINAITVAGNHDWAVAQKITTDNFNPLAKEAIQWTKEQLAQEELNYLAGFELVLRHGDFMMVHGTLNDPERFTYMTDTDLARDTFYLMNKPLIFIGHTHLPLIMAAHEGKISYLNRFNFEVNPLHKYIVNVGSVGQPRDGNPQAAYCIFDPDLRRVEIKRVSYDVKKAQEKIIEAGLPDFLAHRLALGQ